MKNDKILDEIVQKLGLLISVVQLRLMHTVVILINATKQFCYALQNPKWRSKQ